ncbi:MAG TPA: SRPBCC family protein [Actinomycetes bacterium]
MKLENEFVVPVPRDQAWDVLMDVERIAPCMPGATFDGFEGDSFKGRVKVKLGPITVTYAGVARFVERDKETGRAVIDASGKEARGSGTANATIVTVLLDQGDSTLVKVVTDLNITGKPAQFGRGVMVEVGTKILGQFAECLAGQLGSGASEEPAAVIAAAAAESADVPADVPADEPAAGAEPTDNVVNLSQAQRSRAAQPAAPAPRPTADAIDLLDTAGVPVLKRVLPVVAGLLGLWLLLRLLRRLARD